MIQFAKAVHSEKSSAFLLNVVHLRTQYRLCFILVFVLLHALKIVQKRIEMCAAILSSIHPLLPTAFTQLCM